MKRNANHIIPSRCHDQSDVKNEVGSGKLNISVKPKSNIYNTPCHISRMAGTLKFLNVKFPPPNILTFISVSSNLEIILKILLTIHISQTMYLRHAMPQISITGGMHCLLSEPTSLHKSMQHGMDNAKKHARSNY